MRRDSVGQPQRYVARDPPADPPAIRGSRHVDDVDRDARRAQLDALEDRRDPLAATDAERRETVAAFALAELGDEREREAGA